MSGYTTTNLDAALRELGFTHISPESLTAIEPTLPEQSDDVRREYRELMWDMGRLFAEVEESDWSKLCTFKQYVRDKMDDYIAATDESTWMHIVLDVLRRANERT